MPFTDDLAPHAEAGRPATGKDRAAAASPARRPRVLMIAFACNPEGTGEQWLGWGWAEQAAKFCDVTLLTWPRYRAEIERATAAHGVRPICLTAPDWAEKLRADGGPRSWLHQFVWHRYATQVAARLHAEQPFDLVHQTTFHSFRVPFRTAWWGVPSVWGPIAGGESVPPGFGPWLLRQRLQEALRGPLNRLSLAQPAIQRSLRAATEIFVSNRTTLDFLPPWAQQKCQVVPPNAVRPDLPPARPVRESAGGPLQLLYAGNCVPTRALPLVFAALRRVPDLPWRLTVVGGGGVQPEWQREARETGLADRITFTGTIPHAALMEHYREADALVFPGLRDSGGSSLLEAMSLGLPVVCCDWGGPAEMVAPGTGIKISVRSPEETIAQFAAAFERLHAEPAWRKELGRAARERVVTAFSWETKGRLLRETYARCLGRPLDSFSNP